MRLKLKNIGKIVKADIQLDGITVICGENNTGKSTIGKVLFSIYESLCDCDSTINQQRKKDIKDELNKLHKDFVIICKDISKKTNVGIPLNWLDKYVNSLVKQDNVQEVISSYRMDLFGLYNIPKDTTNDRITRWDNRAVTTLSDLCNISDDEILREIVSNQFNSIFYGQLVRIQQEDKQSANVKLIHDNGELEFSFNADNRCTDINREFTISNYDVPIYIENPLVIDYLGETLLKSTEFFRNVLKPSVNYMDIYGKLFSNNIANTLTTSLMEIFSPYVKQNTNIGAIRTEKKVSNLIDMLNSLMNGKFIVDNSILKFKDNDILEPLDIRNLSTGMKSVGILERCLNAQLIKEESILILDEPEIHLHPEWQLKYAEFIVLLQKTLNLTVLITTHSPQFLRAIECYTDKYETMDSLNVYSTTESGIENVSYSEYGISEIYDKLSKPYDTLQQMLDEKYGDDYE
jgi:predicted ATPase